MDENADGTVSQHEFRKGIANLGINVSDEEFAELMETLDEVLRKTFPTTSRATPVRLHIATLAVATIYTH